MLWFFPYSWRRIYPLVLGFAIAGLLYQLFCPVEHDRWLVDGVIGGLVAAALFRPKR